MGIKIVVYTHTDYSYVWPLWFGQANKYLPTLDKYIFVNKEHKDIPTDYTVLTYDDTLPYNLRVASCLERMEMDDIIIFHHEDMFLFSKPKFEILDEFTKVVQTYDHAHIKLLRACDGVHQPSIHNLLYKNPSVLNFSIQPTLIRVRTLYNIYTMNGGKSIWEFESNAGYGSMEHSYYCYNGEAKRGSAHYDSNIYPYIATAVVKGSWNMQEYSNELTSLFYEYKINYI